MIIIVETGSINMAKLTIIILTKHEEKNIKDVVKNAKQCTDDVLIIDSGSTDGTVEVALNCGARTAYRPWDNDFAAQRNFGLVQTKAKWVLYLDADERMDDKLIDQVKKAVTSTSDKQYSFMRKTSAFGCTFGYGALAPDEVTRLFPHASVQWEHHVHERPVCTLPKEKLTGCLRHYTYASWQQWLDKLSLYTTIWAKDSYEQGKRIMLWKIVLRVNFSFVKAYILSSGFLDGVGGLLASWQHMFYTMIKYVKLYEIQRKHK